MLRFSMSHVACAAAVLLSGASAALSSNGDTVALMQENFWVKGAHFRDSEAAAPLNLKVIDVFEDKPPPERVDERGIGDIIQNIKDAFSSLTHNVGNVMDQVHNGIPHWEAQAATTLAMTTASALHALLDPLVQEADSMLNMTIYDREQLQGKVSAEIQAVISQEPNEQKHAEALLQMLDTKAISSLNRSVQMYSTLKGQLVSLGDSVTNAISHAGQPGLASMLNHSLSQAILTLDSYKLEAQQLQQSLNFQVSSPAVDPATISKYLEKVSAKLCKASLKIEAFTELFSQAFQNLMDRLSDSISLVLHGNDALTVMNAFNGVSRTEGNLVWRINSVRREHMLSLNQILADVANATGGISTNPTTQCEGGGPALVDEDPDDESNAN